MGLPAHWDGSGGKKSLTEEDPEWGNEAGENQISVLFNILLKDFPRNNQIRG